MLFFQLLLDVCKIREALLTDTVPWASEKRYIFSELYPFARLIGIKKESFSVGEAAD